ncbi:MAG: hypothetical protein ACXAB9_15840 [Candidatus Thorarchaeota archaeon]|jgi:hypothetical protein
MNKNNDVLAGCGMESIIAVLVLILAPVAYAVRGLVLKQLWIWFVTETFGIIPITSIQAIGLSIVVGFLTHQEYESKKDRTTSEAATSLIVSVFIGPLLALAAGWVVHLFI